MPHLDGKTCLIAGGAGAVGEGIVRVALAEGARVVVPHRSEEELASLRSGLGADHLERLTMLAFDVGKLDQCERLRDRILEAHGGLDAAVVSIGGWWEGGRIVDVHLDDWYRLFHSHLRPHVILARVFLPALARRAGGSFVFINGGSALHPAPGSGPLSVYAAAQLMLKDALVAEQPEGTVRINSLAIMTPVITRKLPRGQESWLTADEIGRCVVHLMSDACTRHGETIRLESRRQLEELS